jgi:hypothetical protein
MRPPTVTNLQRAAGDWDGALQKAEVAIDRFSTEVTRTHPDPLRREAMMNWYQAEGDEGLLRQQSAQTFDPYLKRGYEAALTLTDTEKATANQIRAYHAQRLQESIDAGLLEHGLDNYVHQMWESEDRAPPQLVELLNRVRMGELITDASFIRKRVFQDYFTGEQAGYTPKSKDLAYAAAVYDRSFNRALAGRAFIKSLKKTAASDGRPLVAPSGGGWWSEGDAPAGFVDPNVPLGNAAEGVPKAGTGDYRSKDHPSLRNWQYVMQTEDGTPIMVKGDLRVHPEALKYMHDVLGSSALRKVPGFKGALRFGSESKALKVVGSLFHQAHVGTHAIWHGISPFSPAELNLDDPLTNLLSRRGLQLAGDADLAGFEEGLASGSQTVAGKLSGKIPIVGPRIQQYGDYLFKSYIPRLKAALGKEVFVRNKARYPELGDDEIAVLTARQVEAAFGEINKRFRGRNSTFQDVLRLSLFAPDFLEARGRFVAQALRPYGREQQLALLRGAAIMYVGARALNQLSDGDAHWEPELAFAVKVGDKTYGLRSIQGDIIHLGTDPRSFVYHRLHQTYVRPFLEWLTGRDAYGRPRTNAEQVRDFAVQGAAPINVQGMLEHSAGRTLLDSLLQSVGVNAYQYRTPGERAAQSGMRETMLQREREASDRSQLRRGLQMGDVTPQDLPATMTDRQKKNLQTAAASGDVKRLAPYLSAEQLIATWDKSNPSEQRYLETVIAHRLRSQTLKPEERQVLIQSMGKMLLQRAHTKQDGGPAAVGQPALQPTPVP